MMAARMVARLAGPLPVRLAGGIFPERKVAGVVVCLDGPLLADQAGQVRRGGVSAGQAGDGVNGLAGGPAGGGVLPPPGDLDGLTGAGEVQAADVRGFQGAGPGAAVPSLAGCSSGIWPRTPVPSRTSRARLSQAGRRLPREFLGELDDQRLHGGGLLSAGGAPGPMPNQRDQRSRPGHACTQAYTHLHGLRQVALWPAAMSSRGRYPGILLTPGGGPTQARPVGGEHAAVGLHDDPP